MRVYSFLFSTLLMLAATSSFAAIINTLFDTGVDGSGVALGIKVVDPHWAISDSPGGVPLTAVTIQSPPGAWVPNTASGRWTGTQDAANGNAAQGDYTFQASFDLTGLAPETARIVGQVASDNEILGARINGVAVANFTSAGFGGYHNVSFLPGTAPLIDGINTLELDVRNAGSSINPFGLRVNDLAGHAAPAGTSLVPGLFYDTGVGNNLLNLGLGVADPHFTVSSSPIGAFTPAVIPALPGPWLENITGSQWIGLGSGSSNGPPGVYDFDLNFTLDGKIDLSTIVVEGGWAADNSGSIFLNGNDLGIGIAGFSSLQSFTIPAGSPFVLGPNTLTFRVTNAGLSGTNPFGLRIAGLVGYGTAVPEPSTYALFCMVLLAGFGYARRKRGKVT